MYKIISTVNIEKKFYIYEFWDSLKNEPFYVGKGTKSAIKGRYQRFRDHINIALGIKKQRDPNNHKIRRISKIVRLGGQILVKFVFQTDIESEALEKEKVLIKLYGRRDLGTGTLTNMTNGGEGQSGRIFTEEEKRKISLRVAGIGNPMYGRTHTKESRELIAIGHRGKPGHKHTEEWKQHLRVCNAGGISVSNPIYQIGLDGKVINRFDSAKKAAETLNLKTYGNIYSSIKYKYRTYGGYYWRSIDDSNIENGKLINIDEINKKRLKPHHTKNINQYDMNGNLLKSWKSALDIKRELGISNSIISNIINGKRVTDIYYGYRWESLCTCS